MVKVQIGIDSFAAAFDESRLAVSPTEHLRDLDSAPAVILGAAAVRTHRIRLTIAVTVLSAADPRGACRGDLSCLQL
jgi:alkanesulfonate monooxygenase SsuD/methylene tetrahydromethanopterin reductase-like flavin-dependent oxidoreductase (luciferase family)